MATPTVNPNMEYRRLGNTGLKVSVLSFGSWVTFDTQLDNELALDCMAAAGDAGCNFFDNAEAYAGGKSESIMGQALLELGWERYSYVLTTKVFWGLHGDTPNMRNTLNRKYLMQAIDGSLERFAARLRRRAVLPPGRSGHAARRDGVGDERHRVVGQGALLGHERVDADEIRGAIDIAERHHLHKPVTEQSQYNMLERTKVEVEYARINEDFGYGNTIWSPLASGLLTGKYKDGIPEDSRAALEGYGWLAKRLSDADAIAQVEKLRPIADRLGCTMAQLALGVVHEEPATCRSVITGASKVEQVVSNFEALDVIPLLTDDVMKEIDTALA